MMAGMSLMGIAILLIIAGGGRPLSQVNFNDRNSSAIELAFDDVGNCQADSEI